TWRDASGHSHTSGTITLLPRVAAPLTTVTLQANGQASATSPSHQNLALRDSGSAVARVLAGQRERALPTSRRLGLGAGGAKAHARFGEDPPPATAARLGFVTLSLVESLLHADFRREALQAALPPADPTGFVPTILNEPYTPKVQEITLDYTAQSDDSRLADPAPAALTDTDVQFFQVDALGLAREQAWLNTQRPWAPAGPINLLPAHPTASADPLATPQTLQWSVLADNAWRTLAPGELSLDTTQHLRHSGLVACVLPPETTTAHTRAPAGLVWLRACIPAEPRAACDVIAVHPNALEVQFVDQGNDPLRLQAPLPASSIGKLIPPLAAIKSVAQPFAS
ncbi:MAG: hypothetical protein CFE45_31810, partial [Burkholderiales bacterium PBB5]